ncbi:MAG: hypothetical protein O3C60_02025 [Planctomycetota bacterium]|nr:hypothetical protein [Planctomycetota bacterium]
MSLRTVFSLVLLMGSLPAFAEETIPEADSFTDTGFADPSHVERFTAVAKPSPPSPELATPAQTTPEMWIYAQEQKRLDDPRQIMRRKSQQEGAWRRERIAARKWFGLSNLRPTANPIPTMSASYSPSWGGSHWDPFLWTTHRASTQWSTPSAVIYRY